MNLLTRLRETVTDRTLQDRLVWQTASLMLAYPDEQHAERLDTVDGLLAHVTGRPADLLARTAAALRGTDATHAAQDYVETFDLRRRSTMYLTYWTAGDTRNRGSEMHAFAAVYRDAGVDPPSDEAPDYLPVVLEFAATVDPEAGRRLLVEHRVPIDVLRDDAGRNGFAVHQCRRRGVRDVARGHRPGCATSAAPDAGRAACRNGWPAAVYVDRAAATGRRRPVRCWARSFGMSRRT